jgi:hypothetical protein
MNIIMNNFYLNKKKIYDKQFEIWSNNIYDEINTIRLNRCKYEKILFSKNNIYLIESCDNNKCMNFHYAGHKDIAPFKDASDLEINLYANEKKNIYINQFLISKD